MSFQDIPKVEDYKWYLDLAFRRAQEAGKKMRSEKLEGGRSDKSKYIELRKMQVIADTISSRMESIVKSFPSFDQLPEFYKDLVKVNMDYQQLKRSLGAVNWLSQRSSEFMRIYNSKLDKNKEFDKINVLRREFMGRLSSMIKQIRYDLEFLNQARKIIREFPVVKTSLRTVAIAGFPNVGKTTLLYKLTGSKPQISAYPFTTKGVNVAYFTEHDEKIQILDTPGTLDRFEKMNSIERVAYLTIKHCANIVVYVFDLTEEYDLDLQIKLYERTKVEFGKPMIIYLSKSDIIDKEKIDAFRKKYKSAIIDPDELKKRILAGLFEK